MKPAASWFEISVNDLDRATRFYEKVLDAKLKREEFFGMSLALFPYEAPAPGGALIRHQGRDAGGSSSVVFLNVGGRLDAVYLMRSG